MKIAPNFTLQEFIDPATYGQFGESSIWFLDQRVINIAQFIRERFKESVVINDWNTGGKYKESGYRRPETTTGGAMSQHKFGRAIDVKLIGRANNGANDLRNDITTNFDIYRKFGLTAIEAAEFAPTWCHIDTRWTGLETLLIVKPKQK